MVSIFTNMHLCTICIQYRIISVSNMPPSTKMAMLLDWWLLMRINIIFFSPCGVNFVTIMANLNSLSLLGSFYNIKIFISPGPKKICIDSHKVIHIVPTTQMIDLAGFSVLNSEHKMVNLIILWSYIHFQRLFRTFKFYFPVWK